MTVELSIHNQIFDQEHLEQFIQLLRDPDIRSDEMIRIQYDENGRELPAYGFFNNDDYKKI